LESPSQDFFRDFDGKPLGLMAKGLFGCVDFSLHTDLELLHEPWDLGTGGVENRLGLFGGLTEDLSFSLKGFGLGLAEFLFVIRHLSFHQFLEAFDLGFGFREPLFAFVDHAQKRPKEEAIQNHYQKEEVNDLDSQRIIETDHYALPLTIGSKKSLA
jgi:hypothetical protein